MHQIHYVFWDNDNTLVETAEHHWRKHLETLKTLGITLDEKFRQRVYENNGTQNWQWMSEELKLEMPKDDYLALIDEWYVDNIGDVKIRPGVLDAIRHFSEKDILQAVVSNSRKRSLMAVLDAKDLSRHFVFILGKEDYEGRKPDPTPYLTALEKMKAITEEDIKPENCLVVEDDPLGVKSGEAAGMAVFHRPVGDDKSFDWLLS